MSILAQENAPAPQNTLPVHEAITPQQTDKAAAILAANGLTLADAYKLLIDHIVGTGALPYGLEEPNELTRQTMEKADRGEEIFKAKDLADMMQQLRS